MIYAMFAVVLLTFAIGVLTLTVRVKSVKSGQVKIKYFRAMNGQDVPEFVTRTSRCFSNMFEVPVLFYVVSTLFVSLKIDSFVALILAWLFVVFRVLHTIVHLSYNNVLHRMLIFWAGVFCVLFMWLVLVFSI